MSPMLSNTFWRNQTWNINIEHFLSFKLVTMTSWCHRIEFIQCFFHYKLERCHKRQDKHNKTEMKNIVDLQGETEEGLYRYTGKMPLLNVNVGNNILRLTFNGPDLLLLNLNRTFLTGLSSLSVNLEMQSVLEIHSDNCGTASPKNFD